MSAYIDIGIDEAGCGCLYGAVVAAAFVAQPIEGLRDSKKISATKRERLYGLLSQYTHGIGVVSAQEIDRINILQARLLAMRLALIHTLQNDELQNIDRKTMRVWVDGNIMPNLANLDVQAYTLVGGDDRMACIAGASILAKVYRDRLMLDAHTQHPNYGFHKHKGYPTTMHLQALRQFGVLPEHRRSFAPVRACLI